MAARRSSEPLRTCVGCHRVRSKRELLRLVRAPEGVRVDRTGAAPGRGAYVCPDRACIERARRRLAGALRTTNVDFSVLEEQLV